MTHTNQNKDSVSQSLAQSGEQLRKAAQDARQDQDSYMEEYAEEHTQEYEEHEHQRFAERKRAFIERNEVELKHKPKGSKLTRLDLIKLAGLAVFILIIIGLSIYMAPLIGKLGSSAGRAELVQTVKSAGPLGVFMLLGLQFLQIIVAVVPGEAVQLAAGMMYGPLWGTIIVLLGCVLSSALLYQLVHRLGAPFVHHMIPKKWASKLSDFEKSEKLDLTVFLLFLIPGMPKDVLTYIVPLTNMPFVRFLVLSNVARIPGVLMSTLFADSLTQGNIAKSIVIVAIVAIFSLVGIFKRKDLMAIFNKDTQSSEDKEFKE